MNHWDRVIGINLLTKFHEDKTINLASRVLTRKNATPPADLVFQPIITILVLFQDIMRTNLLTTFHDDQTINVTSRVLTRKNAPPPWQPYWTISVASRVQKFIVLSFTDRLIIISIAGSSFSDRPTD
ncbi:hypothetical protein DPMN_080020 [Dreissena polymorpha]|uniref:Uncharacterized protein n=1 Tax=Dreissena polymorpha TaxID=45954 RepID=A0A9D4BRF4_DREPO|nr:hypothetical protein DPMN_080020 [Dreissena polymorpha]